MDLSINKPLLQARWLETKTIYYLPHPCEWPGNPAPGLVPRGQDDLLWPHSKSCSPRAEMPPLALHEFCHLSESFLRMFYHLKSTEIQDVREADYQHSDSAVLCIVNYTNKTGPFNEITFTAW